ncbi:MAG: DNA gyrase subunit A, partial [Anaerolineae bacterium]|nr:DNA gyrase subunit A [Anaerolineae bacterium]
LQQGRYGVGVRTIARSDKTGDVVSMRCIKEEDEIMVITRNAVVLRTALNAIRETGRSTQGVILINVADGDAVASIAIMKQESEKMPEETQ